MRDADQYSQHNNERRARVVLAFACGFGFEFEFEFEFELAQGPINRNAQQSQR